MFSSFSSLSLCFQKEPSKKKDFHLQLTKFNFSLLEFFSLNHQYIFLLAFTNIFFFSVNADVLC